MSVNLIICLTFVSKNMIFYFLRIPNSIYMNIVMHKISVDKEILVNSASQ